jgi:REP element-mobilizing transposase RayT
MAVIDIQGRVAETATYIEKMVRKVAKQKGVRVCDVVISDNSVFVETDCPEWVSDEVACVILPKSKYGMLVSSTVYEGVFDWASDTYIKPAVVVLFKV